MPLFSVRAVNRWMRSTARLARAAGKVGALAAASPSRKKPAKAASPVASTGHAADAFSAATFSYRRALHSYKLYRPPVAKHGAAPGLLVMLHGCGQGPDDFAAGTRMNALARESNLLVVYPAQDVRANRNRCWNWYALDKQGRAHGEPAWIAALARSVVRTYGVDRRRVYVAGLSAGGAMAALVALCYPEVFAACGVHSGLAVGTARGAVSALSAMRSGVRRPAGEPARQVPTIVFHGSADGTVHPRHGGHVVDAARRGARPRGRTGAGDQPPATVQGLTDGGTAFTQCVYLDEQGRPLAEHWQVQGMGHAWSGGSRRGSYTAPDGPDASREMLRFFAQVKG